MAKHYDKQFKLDAVQYYHDHKNLGLQGCATNLGISQQTLSRWQKELRETIRQADGKILPWFYQLSSSSYKQSLLSFLFLYPSLEVPFRLPCFQNLCMENLPDT